LALIFVIVLMMAATALAEGSGEWNTAPVITRAYEQSSGKVYLEWTGNAALYQVYVDGNKAADVTVRHHMIDLSKGTHAIIIYPIYEEKINADTKIGLDVDLPLSVGDAVNGIANSVGGMLGIDLGSWLKGGSNSGTTAVSIGLDLKALGLDPKNLIAGTPSEPLNIDYRPDPILDGVPEHLSASIDFDNRVALSFSDPYNADEYEIMIKNGGNVNYATFRRTGEEDASFITRSNDRVTVLLDPDFLLRQGCAAPSPGQEYRFSVVMRRYTRDFTNGEIIATNIHASRKSAEIAYKPVSLWKTAPVITFASQTADGEITLRWEHEDHGLGIEYAVMQVNRVLGVVSGETQMGRTQGHEFILRDVLNAGYNFCVVPVYGGEKGSSSDEVHVEVRNDWILAPALECEQTGATQVKLTWMAPASIEKYHIVVYTGSGSAVLRLVNLGFSKYTEFDVDAVEGRMEYIFEYDQKTGPAGGAKLKFEIWGLRHTDAGEEQKSAVSSRIVVLK